MRVAILGAGGVGGYYGGLLSRSGHTVEVLARGENLAAIRERGLEVRTPADSFIVRVRAVADAADLSEADVALLAVKTFSLPHVLPAVRALAGRGATVLPLLNGVEAVDRLVEGGVAFERILPGLTEISASKIGPGVVARHSPFQRIVVGEVSGETSERARQIVAAFAGAGVEARISADITADLWRKLAFIASIAAACGLSRAPIGALREAPLGPVLLSRAVNEAFDVARACGVPLRDDEAARVLSSIQRLPGELKPSLLRDLEAGGRTEIDDLCGAISRLGRGAGRDTPVHDTATAALSV